MEEADFFLFPYISYTFHSYTNLLPLFLPLFFPLMSLLTLILLMILLFNFCFSFPLLESLPVPFFPTFFFFSSNITLHLSKHSVLNVPLTGNTPWIIWCQSGTSLTKVFPHFSAINLAGPERGLSRISNFHVLFPITSVTLLWPVKDVRTQLQSSNKKVYLTKGYNRK